MDKVGKNRLKRKEQADKKGQHFANIRISAVSTSEKVAINVQHDVLPTTSALPVVSESGDGANHLMNDEERTSSSPIAASTRVAKLRKVQRPVKEVFL